MEFFIISVTTNAYSMGAIRQAGKKIGKEILENIDNFFSKGTTPEIIHSLRTIVKASQRNDANRARNRKNFEMAKYNLKKLAKAGVTIGLGTDTGPPV